ncbi:relaxase domain-containing protein [Nocardioides sp. B-3]|uniref:relaxase domain-containing protein n=1 Tax=Nocardioides sp. B-3 TaxID=2895565 RepID=UPI003FA5CB59
MPQSLTEQFSSRSHDINTETDRLIEEYVANHGRRPRPATIMKLRQRANLAHRPEKQIHSLADLTTMWRRRAARNVGEDATTGPDA